MIGNAEPVDLDLSPDEVGQILDIESHSFPHPWTVADFEWVSADPRSVKIGLWLTDRLVGYAIGTDEGGVLHLVGLAVEEAHRRQGWGGRLLAVMLERGRHRQCRSCRLEVRRSNEPAMRLYRKFGFSVHGVQRRFYTQPVEDAWLLERCLAAATDPRR